MNNFQKNYSTGEVEVVKGDSRSCIYHKTEYRERRNHYAVYAVNACCVTDLIPHRESFLGTYGCPRCLHHSPLETALHCNSVAERLAAMRYLSGWILRLNRTKAVISSYMLGYIENPA